MALKKTGVQLVAEDASKFESDLKGAERAVTEFGDSAEKAGRGVTSFGEVATGALRKVGELAVSALIEGTKAIANFVGESINLAGDFEGGMNRFESAVGDAMEGSGQDIGDFKDLFLTLGAELPVSTSEVQEAAITLVKGGIDPLILSMGGLRDSIQFAAAAELDLNQAAEIGVKQLGVWTAASATAEEKTKFLAMSQDLLVKAAGASTLNVDSLAKAMNVAGGQAKALNLDYKDFAIGLTLISPGFNSAEEAGTSFKNFLARIQPSTNPAKKALAELGLYTKEAGSAFFTAKGEYVGNAKAAELLKQATKDLTAEKRGELLQTIFGNDAMGAANILASAGAEGYEILAAKIAAASGVTEAAAAKQKGFNTAMTNASGSVEALKIRIGDALLPTLTDLLNTGFTPIVNAAGEFFKKLDEGATPMDAFKSAVVLLPGPLRDFAQAGIEAGEGVMSKLREFGNTEWGQAIQRGAQVAVDYLSGPFFTDIGAAVDGIKGKFDEFAASPWGQEIQRVAGEAAAYMTGPFAADFARGVDDVAARLDAFSKSPWATDIKEGAAVAAAYFSGPFVGEVERGVANVQGRLESFGKSPWATDIKEGAGVVAAYFSGPFAGEVERGVANVQSRLETFAASPWGTDIREGAQLVASYFSGPFAGEVERGAKRVEDGVAKLAAYFSGPFQTEVQGGVDRVKNGWNTFTSEFTAGVKRVEDAVNNWVKQVQDGAARVENAFDTAIKGIANMWEGFNWADVGSEVINGIISGISGGAGRLASAAAQVARDAFNAATEALGISSPSKLAREGIGQPFTEGMALGVLDNIDMLTGASADLGVAALTELTAIGNDARELWGEAMRLAGESGAQRFLDQIKQVGNKASQALAQALQQSLDFKASIPRAAAEAQALVQSIFNPAKMVEELAKPNGAVLQNLAQAVGGALAQAGAEAQVLGGLDPEAAGQFYDFRVSQIEEIARLEQEQIAARTKDERLAIQERINLIREAQIAERTAYANALADSGIGETAMAQIEQYVALLNSNDNAMGTGLYNLGNFGLMAEDAIAAIKTVQDTAVTPLSMMLENILGSRSSAASLMPHEAALAAASSMPVQPVATPGQIASGTSSSMNNSTTYNYAPTYAAAPRQPLQDFVLMRALAAGAP